VKRNLHYDYTTVGHVTIDVLDDGTRRAGGGAFYSALQAARLGRRTLILTRGLPRDIDALLEPYRNELDVHVQPAPSTTTLRTFRSGPQRSQSVLAWAGAIAEEPVLDTAILHLAPVARESPSRWRGRAAFVGLTPQGLVREWAAPENRIKHAAAPVAGSEALAARCNALVVNEHERASCARLIDAAGAAGGVVAITAGHGPNTILLPDQQQPLVLDVPALQSAVDDLGAGDVFAAAFFIALSDGRAPAVAAGFANAAAAVRMRGVGAAAIGGLDAIQARLSAVEK
jgi:hypothetical protein